jgi:uncharacterized protein YndB with AHSA1/START domain
MSVTEKPMTDKPEANKPEVNKHSAVVTLPSDTQILITREFAASAHLVYRAWTTPELIKRWWAGDQGEVVSIEVDLRVGGTWRYVMTAHAGFEVAFHGEYREIVPNARLVHTDVFEPMPDHPALTTVTFTEAAGRTTVTLLVEHLSKEDRDAHVNSGMETGMQSSMDHLEEIVLALA